MKNDFTRRQNYRIRDNATTPQIKLTSPLGGRLTESHFDTMTECSKLIVNTIVRVLVNYSKKKNNFLTLTKDHL